MTDQPVEIDKSEFAHDEAVMETVQTDDVSKVADNGLQDDLED
jgi:hypothetical protein